MKIKTSRINVHSFGALPDKPHEIIRRYTITNKNNAYVRLITLGAGIQSITLPNKNGDMTDVVLGFDNVIGYLKNRYIGRIIGKIHHPLTKYSEKYTFNNMYDCCSFDIVNWDSYILGEEVIMTYTSHNSNEKYPNNLLIQVKYNWTDDYQLHVGICVISTKPTYINVSNYCLFNLAGHDMGAKELKHHIISINTNSVLQYNNTKGASKSVIHKVNTKLNNLRNPTKLSKKILKNIPGGGYNHNVHIASSSSSWHYRFHARILHPATGRFLEIYSNHPTLNFYTGNNLPNFNKINLPDIGNVNIKSKDYKFEKRIIGKHGIPYKKHGCLALIPEWNLKSLNSIDYSLKNLNPGNIYSHKITYKFGVII